jgi:hypothetical protein
MVGLAKINCQAQGLRLIVQRCGNIIQRVGSINLRLPRTEQVEIGAVEYENNGFGHARAYRARYCGAQEREAVA